MRLAYFNSKLSKEAQLKYDYITSANSGLPFSLLYKRHLDRSVRIARTGFEVTESYKKHCRILDEIYCKLISECTVF